MNNGLLRVLYSCVAQFQCEDANCGRNIHCEKNEIKKKTRRIHKHTHKNRNKNDTAEPEISHK